MRVEGDNPGQESGLLIEPISELQQDRVRAATEWHVGQARKIFRRHFQQVPVTFDLRGEAAGMFKVVGSRRWIRYNPWIFAKYFDDNLQDTVPHEVAHFVVHELYGTRGVKPHGWQWQEVMTRFGVDPAVTFKLDLAGIPRRRQQSHPYRCACQRHEVSTTRHNRVGRGVGRGPCRSC